MFPLFLGGGLLLIGLLYLFVSLSDTVEEVKSIFDLRLLRRGLRFNGRDTNYSIVDLLVVTGLCGVAMGLVRAQAIPAGMAWLHGMGFIFCYYGGKYIGYDLTMHGQRRVYPSRFNLSPPREQVSVPVIQVHDE